MPAGGRWWWCSSYSGAASSAVGREAARAGPRAPEAPRGGLGRGSTSTDARAGARGGLAPAGLPSSAPCACSAAGAWCPKWGSMLARRPPRLCCRLVRRSPRRCRKPECSCSPSAAGSAGGWWNTSHRIFQPCSVSTLLKPRADRGVAGQQADRLAYSIRAAQAARSSTLLSQPSWSRCRPHSPGYERPDGRPDAQRNQQAPADGRQVDHDLPHAAERGGDVVARSRCQAQQGSACAPLVVQASW